MDPLASPDLKRLLHKLTASISGDVLTPGKNEFERARRVWNGMHDRVPAGIVRCRSSLDIGETLRLAARTGSGVTVRGGGHNVAGHAIADGAVMIDLSGMRGVVVDEARRLAHVEGGCLLGDLDKATIPLGLACPSGVVSDTGIGGLALGGGYGWLARKYGLTCDHLLSAEVVLADGSITVASERENLDLLWALRGGGGNFGVVAQFSFALRPVPPIWRKFCLYSLEQAPAALARYSAFAASQGDDVHAVATLLASSGADWVPAGLTGQPLLVVRAIALAEPPAARSALAGLFEGVPCAAAIEGPISYAGLQAMGDGTEPHGDRYFTKSCYLRGIPAEAVTALLASMADVCSPLSCVDFEYLRGAISEGPAGGSAFPGRSAPYICTFSAHWKLARDDVDNVRWAREGVYRLADWHYGGAYVNYVQDSPVNGAVDVYGRARYGRLSSVKRQYDPDNIFVHNQNIRPDSSV